MKKLAIIVSHPIQYYAPVFKLLAENKNLAIKVFYTLGNDGPADIDKGFGKKITWDIDLLHGYPYEWVNNTSRNPGSHYFNGIVNPDIVKQVDVFAPNAILVFGWSYHGHLKVMRHYHGKIPVYFRGDSTLIDNEAGLKAVIKALLLKWVYKNVDVALYVGTNNRAYFKKYGLKDSQLVYAPHAIDNDRFAIDRSAEAAAFRQNLNLTTDNILILFAGKFIAKKDPLILLQAFKALNKPNVHLLFVGDGELLPQIKFAANGNTNIHFLGFQNQSVMPVVYQAGDLFCLPSQGPGETWGLAVNEAMASNKAVVVSDKCGCAIDLVKPGVNGFIFESNHVDQLTQYLTILCKDKQLLAGYGKASADIIKHFSFLTQIAAIENLLNEA